MKNIKAKNTKKDLIKYLKRYCIGKSLEIQVERENDPLDCSDSETEIIINDYSYHIYILKRRKRKYLWFNYYVYKHFEINKKLFKKLKKSITFRKHTDHSVTCPVEEFIEITTTRAEKIEKLLK